MISLAGAGMLVMEGRIRTVSTSTEASECATRRSASCTPCLQRAEERQTELSRARPNSTEAWKLQPDASDMSLLQRQAARGNLHHELC